MHKPGTILDLHVFRHLAAPTIRCILPLLFLAVFVAGCAPRIIPQAHEAYTQAPEKFPEAYYRQAEVSGSTVLRIDAKRSLVAIDVRRGGTLARLGHDHVVASHDVTGYVDITAGRADLYVALERLRVDEPALRAEAGLSSPVSDEAIAGTRRNMLDKVLESERYPLAFIRITRAAIDRSTLSVTITLHGTEKTFEVPAQIATTPDGLNISGQMTFNQTDFGITPFSILGGAIQVQDRVNLRFKIFASTRIFH